MTLDIDSVFYGAISLEEILDYATKIIEESKEYDEEILQIACLNISDKEKIKQLVHKLASYEKKDDDIEFRKLRFLFVKKSLPMYCLNYIDGIMGLTDIWLNFECDQYCPHIFQTNDISPEDYYTEDNYKFLIYKHIEWLTIEGEYLRHYQ